MEDRSNTLAKDAEGKYDTAKQSVRRTRDSAEQLYDEARNSADRGARQTRDGLEQAEREAKEKWFSWKAWGKSKAEEGGKKVEEAKERSNKDN